MENQAHKALARAEALLAARSSREALKLLDSIPVDSLQTDLSIRFGLLHIEAKIEVGDYSQDQVDELIERLRHKGTTSQFAKAKYLKGQMLSLLGRHGDAREVLVESYVHYSRCQDLLGTVKSLNRLSYVEFQLGNTQAAVTSLERCRRACDNGGDPKRANMAAINLAYMNYSAGSLRDSILIYHELNRSMRTLPDKARAAFHLMRPVPVALKGDTTKALELIEQARELVEPFPREKAIFFENLGLIYLLDNQPDKASEALRQGMDISLKIAPESTLVSQIGRLQADVALAQGDHESARTHVDRALKVAQQVGERIEIAACWRVLAHLAQHDGDHTAAAEHYRKAIDLFKQIGARYELAATQYRAAVSGLFANGERMALLYMAREYFESEDVTPFLQKIDTELSRTKPAPAAAKRRRADAPHVVAGSSAMKKIVSLSEHIACSEMTVLLTGETGTGKDLLARYIHHCSDRPGEFVSVNTAAIPNEMVEAELFGYTRGAFTGATQDRNGLVQQAHKGTLYLNEIADATAEFQAKLLEVIESKMVRRLGENEPRAVDVRVIAATNRDLQQWIREGSFRLDLFHRLNEVPIHLPPLRERTEDIQPLVQAFLQQEGVDGQLDNASLRRLARLMASSAWLGNVRQLQAEIKRLWLLSRGDMNRLLGMAADHIDRLERENLLTLLKTTDWNRREVARRLDLSEGTIRKRMARYGIEEQVPQG